jgi:hypothetical protein
MKSFVQTLPPERNPSCCFPLFKVLSRLCYDAYVLRQASDVSTSSRPSTQPPNIGFPNVARSLCKLRSTSGLAPSTLPKWDFGTFLGFFPFQRHHHWTSQTGLPSCRSPPTGFVHLSAGIFVRHDRRAYSISPALPGFGPSKFHRKTIGHCLPVPDFCVVIASTWLPFPASRMIPCHPSPWRFPVLHGSRATGTPRDSCESPAAIPRLDRP